ncbi:FAD-dependent monooxygenase [Streptomyces sp. NBC_01283]|uniref:NAD(P)/FAD-dependent oxidoreductase n=1 Tax=Streptomyces sp. NBC_01283 TaxID=2903812 RepID=UPI00352C969E|nr:FAD-dependent monooxygenase [Streptomyces sp. NBC_01283]
MSRRDGGRAAHRLVEDRTAGARVVGDRALVLGASIAGTLAARVLADFYREVIVIDRDHVIDVEDPRRGAPHAAHAHGLHARGCLILQEFFPNLLKDMRRAHQPIGDLGEQRWYFNGRPFTPTRTGLLSLTAPRPVLEGYLRGQVAARANVTYRQGTALQGLLATADGARVTGARLQSTTPGAACFDLEADLLVDASGRGSRTPVWLQQLGYQRPVEQRMPIGLAYTTRLYRSPHARSGPQFVNCLASPASPRGAFFGQAGDDRHILSLTGLLGDHPPTDPDGFTAFAQGLPAAEIHDRIHDATPLTDPVTFRFPASVRRHYERLSRLPERLLVLGDAVCSLNPNYSQGMTVAAMQASALHQYLQRRGTPDSAVFMRQVGRILDKPWYLSTTSDLKFTGATGRRQLTAPVLNAYVTRLHHAATHDPAATDALMRVASLIDHPATLLRPRLVLTALSAPAARLHHDHASAVKAAPAPDQQQPAPSPPLPPPTTGDATDDRPVRKQDTRAH